MMSPKPDSGRGPCCCDHGDSMAGPDDAERISLLKKCYRKHVIDDEDIGVDELSGHLGNALIGAALAQIMGDEEFCAWVDSL